jgi:DNA-binding NtrC family response regulator
MSILIADDDDRILLALKILLKSENMPCVACRSPAEAVETLRRQSCELALIDLNFLADTTSGNEGLALINSLRELDEDLPIVAMTGWGTVSIAVEAMKRGAADFVEKPWSDNDYLLKIIRTQLQLRAAREREKKLTAENALLRDRSGDDVVVSLSPAMQRLLSMAKRIATSSMPVLITGENGTGKSLLAGYIHHQSARAHGPFISVNMGAISGSIFESEMFGHVKGAFTDAKTARLGRVELADKGTLFMDEIANLPLPQQAKILRLLEEQQYEKLGSSQTQQADLRFVSATNADLDGLVVERGFRQDLLYRLNGVTLNIPSLRERKEDIQPLAEGFMQRARQHYVSSARRFSSAAMVALQNHAWPGNIRELQHVIERAVLLAEHEEVLERDLQLPRSGASGQDADELASMTLEQAETWFINRALKKHRGNANEAARALGMSRSALYRRLGNRDPA